MSFSVNFLEPLEFFLGFSSSNSVSQKRICEVDRFKLFATSPIVKYFFFIFCSETIIIQPFFYTIVIKLLPSKLLEFVDLS